MNKKKRAKRLLSAGLAAAQAASMLPIGTYLMSMTVMAAENGTTSENPSSTVTADNAQASIIGSDGQCQYYETVQEAYKAASDNDTITLTKDITGVAENGFLNVSGDVKAKTVTINLNYKNVTSVEGTPVILNLSGSGVKLTIEGAGNFTGQMSVTGGAKLTLTNGTYTGMIKVGGASTILKIAGNSVVVNGTEDKDSNDPNKYSVKGDKTNGGSKIYLEAGTLNNRVAPSGDFEMTGGNINGSIRVNNPDKTTINVNIKGGKIDASDGRYAISSRAEVSFANVTISDSAKIVGETVLWEHMCLTVNGGELSNSTSGFVITTNGSHTSRDAKIKITDGVIKHTGGEAAIYLPAGQLEITGGTIEGANAIGIRSGMAKITGGTFVGTGARKEAPDFAPQSGDGLNASSEAIVVANSNYPQGAPKVEITGGTFTANSGEYAVNTYIAIKNGEQLVDHTVKNFVKGGTFNKPVPDDVLALDYVCVKTAADTYKVVSDSNVIKTLDFEVAAPEYEKELATTATSKTNINAKAEVSWKLGDEVVTGKPTKDGTYTATMTVTAKEGYYLNLAEEYTFSNGTEENAVEWKRVPSDKGDVVFTLEFELAPREIESVYFKVENAKYGEAPDTTVKIDETEGYKGTVAWAVNEGTVGEKFEADKTYTATVTLTPDEGYKFQKGGSFTVEDWGTGTIGTDGNLTFKREYVMPKTEEKPKATIDYTAETLKDLAADKYTINGTDVTVTADSVAIETAWFGTNISIVKVGDNKNTVDSAAQELEIPARRTAPNVTAVNETEKGKGGKLTGVDNTMEYKAEADTKWTAITGESVNVTAGTYNVRYKATTSAFASAEKEVTVTAYEATPIESVSVTLDTNAAKHGVAAADVKAKVADGANYEVKTTWTDSEGNTVDTFVGGKTYTVIVTLNANTGYAFTSETNAEGFTYDPNTGTLTCKKTVDVAVETFTVTIPENVTVKNGETAVNSGDKVKKGTEITINATAPEGKKLKSLTVNGTEFKSGDTFTVSAAVDIKVEFEDAIKEQAAPAAPEAESVTNTSVKLKAIAANANGAAAQYSIDGKEWKDSVEFTGLTKNTKYTFYARYKAVEGFSASPASKAAEISTANTSSSGGGSSSGGSGGGGSYRPSNRPSTSVTTPVTDGKTPVSEHGTVSGWTSIAADINTTKGGTVDITTNGAVKVPKEVITAAAGKDIVLTVKVDETFSWDIDANNITGKEAFINVNVEKAEIPAKAHEIPAISAGEKVIDIAVTNMNFSLKPVLKANLGKAEANKFANLFKLNESTQKLEFAGVTKIAADGSAIIPVEKIGKYTIVVSNETKMMGDYDNSTGIDAKDASLLLKEVVTVLESGAFSFKGDVDGDGKVNAKDAAAILKMIVGAK